MVVKGFCSRGAPIPTRSGGLVVRTVSSCLGVIVSVGMDDKGLGCRIC